MEQRIIISDNLDEDLAVAISECEHDRVFVLTDSVTREKCLPKISGFHSMRKAHVITIGDTDTHKTLDSLAQVWKELGDNGATRHSCMVNLGGGMVTDLGGFAASTFNFSYCACSALYSSVGIFWFLKTSIFPVRASILFAVFTMRFSSVRS